MNSLRDQSVGTPKAFTLKTKLGGAVAIALFLWVGYTVERYTDFRFPGGSKRPMPIEFPLYGTPILLVGAYFSWKTTMSFYNNSLAMHARITNIGMIFRGWCDVTVSYSVGHKVHTKKISILGSEATQLRVGSSMPILMDQRKPSRVIADPEHFRTVM